MNINNKELENLVFKSVSFLLENINETNLIKPVDMSKKAPYQPIYNPDEFNYYFNIYKSRQIDLPKEIQNKLDKHEITFDVACEKAASLHMNNKYQNIEKDSINQQFIDKTQKRITQNIQNNLLKTKGSKKPNYDNINMSGPAIKDIFYDDITGQEEIIKKLGDFPVLKKFDELTRDFNSNPPQFKIKFDGKTKYYVKKDEIDDISVAGQVFAYGNSKLPPNILIINLNSAYNCPSAKFCQFSKTNRDKVNGKKCNLCYAQKDEGFHTNVQLRNIRNEQMFDNISLIDFMRLLTVYIEQAPVRINYIRINESGDFKTQEQIDMADKIAAHVSKKYGIITSCYSRNQSLDFSNIKYLNLNASATKQFPTATRYFLALSKDKFNNLPDKTPLKVHKLPVGDDVVDYFICKGNCTVCKFCYQTKEQNSQMYGESTDPNIKTRVFALEH